MNCTKLSLNVQNTLNNLFGTYPILTQVAQQINSLSGKLYLVGGAVRDALLQLPLGDIDLEVHGVSLDQLAQLLQQFGEVDFIGKSFGVLRIFHLPIDWSLPRVDSTGRKPSVTVIPTLTIKDALRRRDLTMNAMAIDMVTGVLIDPFNGCKDLQDKILRAPDSSFFAQDPLRFFRVMHFIGRFEMYPDETLNQVCKTMDLKGISCERIEMEFEKLLLKSRRPSLGIRWIKSLSRLQELLPELAQTVTTHQNLEWHPEDTVFEHLMQSLDAAALLSCDTAKEKLTLLYAALCHDLGKVSTTRLIKGKLRSYGHAQAGVRPAINLLKRITRNTKLINTVATLVNFHMHPSQFVKQNVSLAAYKRLALKLEKYTSIKMLWKLFIADRQGRNGLSHEPLNIHIAEAEQFKHKALQAHVFEGPEKPLLQGRDIATLINSGPLMGQALMHAYKIQIEKGIQDKTILKAEVERYIQRIKK